MQIRFFVLIVAMNGFLVNAGTSMIITMDTQLNIKKTFNQSVLYAMRIENGLEEAEEFLLSIL